MSIGMEAVRALPRRAAESFRMIPDRLWMNRRLQPFDLRLWCALHHLARGRGWCEATDADLAKQTGASEQTVRRGLARLGREQFISRSMDGRSRIIALNPAGNGEPMPAVHRLRVVS